MNVSQIGNAKAEKQQALKEAKIYEIKHEINTNKKLLELLSFKRTLTEYSLAGDKNTSNCQPCQAGKELLTNEEVNPDEIKFCPRHFKVYLESKDKAIKDNKRLEKRLMKLESLVLQTK